ncbi:hypothetical protein BDQ94DRAFT_135237 [Aspergillus welwitschiae]|uniref:Uncharacterized protein n=1 Tax=Aspergillus welwitschiae TaxID=1341132 RepID=A0A3F3QFI0_9EURO|nr:hypothetical protein BDQ94DRAFT_135237 [Aspergillus welwitschiae]RDH37897.1 hypothetical protein BDQ94DRAFT_135237 [Aspergillus welwitschiae]
MLAYASRGSAECVAFPHLNPLIGWIYLVSVDDAGFGSDLDGSIAQYPHRRLRIYFQEARSTVAQAILA